MLVDCFLVPGQGECLRLSSCPAAARKGVRLHDTLENEMEEVVEYCGYVLVDYFASHYPEWFLRDGR